MFNTMKTTLRSGSMHATIPAAANGRWHSRARVGVVVAAALVSPAAAQWDSGQFVAPGPNEKVQALMMHDDGSGPALYVGGSFDAIDGIRMGRIVRWNGFEWSPVGAASGTPIVDHASAFAEYDGNLIAGGRFVGLQGSTHYIAQWDGAAWQTLGQGTSSSPLALTNYNGDLVAGGTFTTAGGQPASRIARWDGQQWHAMGDGLNGTVWALTVFNGELIAGGSFSPGNVARWTGSTWETLGSGVNGLVRTLTVHNGELYGGGSFTNAGGLPANRIARWDGAAWHAAGDGFSSSVLCLVSVDSTLFAGGDFESTGTVPARGIARWDGTSWSAVGEGVVGDPVRGIVNAILPEMDVRGVTEGLIIGGWFVRGGNTCANNLVRYDDGQWSRVSECETCLGPSGQVAAIVVHDDGAGEALFAGGNCHCAGSLPINGLGRWDGKQWNTLGVTENVRVLALVVFDDGSGPALYAGGFFSSIGGVQANNLAKWDGRSWSALGEGLAVGVASLIVFDDGSGPALYAGGWFPSPGGAPGASIARWDGNAWSDVGGGVTASGQNSTLVADMVVWDDGTGPSLVVGGKFDAAGGVPTFALARWRNGAWSGIGGFGFYPAIESVTTWPLGSTTALIVGGPFTTGAGNDDIDGMAIWDGATWSHFPPPIPSFYNDEINELHVINTGECTELVVYLWDYPGMLTIWNGSTWRSMGGGQHDASGVTWGLTFPGGSSQYLLEMASFETFQGRLYYGGDFTSIGGQPAHNLAIWDAVGDHACEADSDDDGEVNVDDLIAVILQWGPCGKSCSADGTPCGGDGIVDVDDLVAVILSWGACP
jgi:trimeric autotransporter adhesin